MNSAPVLGNAPDEASYVEQVAPADTFVQLVGVAHLSPRKALEFRKVDMVSGLAAASAAKRAGIRPMPEDPVVSPITPTPAAPWCEAEDSASV